MQPWCVRPSFEGTWPTLLVCTAVCPAQTNSAVFFKQRRIHKSGRKLTAVMQAVKLWHKVRMVVKQPWKEFASSLEAERRISPEAALNGQRSKPKKHWEAELEKALEAQKIRRAHRPRSGITSITSGSFPTSFCNFTWGSCFLMFFILYPVRRPSATPCPSFTDTHTQLFYTKLVHTHTTLLHTTLSNVTHNSSHKKLSRTHTHTHKSSRTTLLHTQCLTHTHTHTILSHTHTQFTHDSCTQPVLHHVLCLSSLSHPTSTLVWHYWKKLTCGFSGPLMPFLFRVFLLVVFEGKRRLWRKWSVKLKRFSKRWRQVISMAIEFLKQNKSNTMKWRSFLAYKLQAQLAAEVRWTPRDPEI